MTYVVHNIYSSSRMMNKIVDFYYEKDYVNCRFKFKAYANNVKGEVAKCSLKTTEVVFHADEHVVI